MNLKSKIVTKVFTPEERLEKRKIVCQHFLDKCKREEEGIIDEPLTKEKLEEIRKLKLEKKRLYNANFREIHRTEYNLYMNNKMKEKYKNDEEFRIKERERSKLRSLKYRQSKETTLVNNS